MSSTIRKTKILAPAGSINQLVMAVNNGCDAVYLGLDNFNARMKAPNFTINNLREWVKYCHLFGVQVYVAINTSIKNEELANAVSLLLDAYKLNIDGVIVTDLALMRLASMLPKPFDVVASTQLNVHDKLGAEFVKKCGATTVVCARECSLSDISQIAASNLNIECFLHGALCVCQSGQCLFSSMVGGNSGNRGLCAQPCRQKYTVTDIGRSGYLLSARDICGTETAKLLVEAGATTFKIEGRNRRPEYSGITSRVYKELFENSFVMDKRNAVALKEMYNRDMSSNSYLFEKNDEIVCDKCQNHSGVYIGKVNGNYVKTEIELLKGDGVKVFDNGVEKSGGVVLESGSGRVRVDFNGDIADGMAVHRTTSVALCSDVASAKRRIPVSLQFDAKVDSPVVLTVKYGDIVVVAKSDYLVQKALKASLSAKDIAKQLQKTGETPYTISDIILNFEDVFIAKSQINALRREVLEKLTIAIIDRYEHACSNRQNAELILPALNRSCAENACAVICRNVDELVRTSNDAKYVIFKPSIINKETIKIAAEHKCYLDIPSFSDTCYLNSLIKNTDIKLICHNVSHVELARSLGLKYIAGSGLNIFNDYIASEFSDADTFVYSQELTLNEIAHFNNQSGLTFVDGQITLMKLVHCPYKVVYGGDCASCKANNKLTYIDEKGNAFYFEHRRDSRCSFELINGRKLSVTRRLSRGGRYLIDYDERVLRHYLALNCGKESDYIETRDYTKGRLFDKVN